MNMLNHGNNMGFLRRNLAVIIAAFSLLASSVGWVSAYNLLTYRVSQIELKAAVAATEAQAASKIMTNHASTPGIHLDQRTWEMLIGRLDRIEALLQKHMAEAGRK